LHAGFADASSARDSPDRITDIEPDEHKLVTAERPAVPGTMLGQEGPAAMTGRQGVTLVNDEAERG
jgi:hypothetical protein